MVEEALKQNEELKPAAKEMEALTKPDTMKQGKQVISGQTQTHITLCMKLFVATVC